jgi:hypothetical protein
MEQPVRDAADQKAVDRPEAARSHDDHVGVPVSRELDDRVPTAQDAHDAQEAASKPSARTSST